MMRVTHFGTRVQIYSEKKVSKSDDSYTLWSIRGKDKNKQVSKSDDTYTKVDYNNKGAILRGGWTMFWPSVRGHGGQSGQH